MKKIISISAILLSCLCLFAAPTFAASQTQDGLKAVLATDKTSYIGFGKIKAILVVQNNSGKTINKISLKNVAPKGYKLSGNSKRIKNIKSLDPDETASLSVTYVREGINPFILMLSIIIVACIVAVLLILRKKGKNLTHPKTFVLILGVLVSGAVTFSMVNAVKAAETGMERRTMLLNQNVRVNFVNVALEGVVEYQLKPKTPNVGKITFTKPSEAHIATDKTSKTTYVDNEVLITGKTKATKSQIENLIKPYDGRIIGEIAITQDYQVRFPQVKSLDELKNIVKNLNQNDAVDTAEIHELNKINSDAVPNDKKWKGLFSWSSKWPDGKNWGVEAIDAMGAWDHYDQMQYVNVGIIDSMFDTHHEDLDYVKVWNNPENIYQEKDDTIREHGTHVSGTMAAKYNNKIGIAGVMPKANVYAYSFLGEGTDLNYSNLMGSMQWKYALANLITSKCKVLNVSMGHNSNGNVSDMRKISAEDGKILGQFLNKFLNKGYDFVIVQAAGNDSSDAIENGIFSGISKKIVKDRVIEVGGIGGEYSGKKLDGFNKKLLDGSFYYSDYSNYGERVDVVAPGDFIYSTVPGNKYNNTYKENKNLLPWSGTSMAASHVSGIAAMCYAVNPKITGDQVKSIIKDTAATKITDKNQNIKKAHPKKDYQLVNAKSAVEKALNERGKKQTEQTADTGIVMGNVNEGKDSSGERKPLEKVEIRVYQISENNEKESKLIARTTSDVEGNYELLLKPGKYQIKFSKKGYVSQTINNVTVTKNQITYLDNVVLKVEKDEELEDMGVTNSNALVQKDYVGTTAEDPEGGSFVKTTNAMYRLFRSRLIKTDANGNDQTIYTGTELGNLNYYKNWLYFTDLEGISDYEGVASAYKIHPDGTGLKKLFETDKDTVKSEMIVYNNHLYFSRFGALCEDGRVDKVTSTLNSYNLEGNSKKNLLVSENQYDLCFGIENDHLYVPMGNKITVIDLKDDSKDSISLGEYSLNPGRGSYDGFTIAGGKLYGISNIDNGDWYDAIILSVDLTDKKVKVLKEINQDGYGISAYALLADEKQCYILLGEQSEDSSMTSLEIQDEASNTIVSTDDYYRIAMMDDEFWIEDNDGNVSHYPKTQNEDNTTSLDSKHIGTLLALYHYPDRFKENIEADAMYYGNESIDGVNYDFVTDGANGDMSGRIWYRYSGDTITYQYYTDIAAETPTIKTILLKQLIDDYYNTAKKKAEVDDYVERLEPYYF